MKNIEQYGPDYCEEFSNDVSVKCHYSPQDLRSMKATELQEELKKANKYVSDLRSQLHGLKRKVLVGDQVYFALHDRDHGCWDTVWESARGELVSINVVEKTKNRTWHSYTVKNKEGKLVTISENSPGDFEIVNESTEDIRVPDSWW
jgi:hypothetical protein